MIYSYNQSEDLSFKKEALKLKACSFLSQASSVQKGKVYMNIIHIVKIFVTRACLLCIPESLIYLWYSAPLR